MKIHRLDTQISLATERLPVYELYMKACLKHEMALQVTVNVGELTYILASFLWCWVGFLSKNQKVWSELRFLQTVWSYKFLHHSP